MKQNEFCLKCRLGTRQGDLQRRSQSTGFKRFYSYIWWGFSENYSLCIQLAVFWAVHFRCVTTAFSSMLWFRVACVMCHSSLNGYCPNLCGLISYNNNKTITFLIPWPISACCCWSQIKLLFHFVVKCIEYYFDKKKKKRIASDNSCEYYFEIQGCPTDITNIINWLADKNGTFTD